MSIHAGRSKYYKGKISRVRADGTFDVAYDDGEAETRVEERLIRSLDGGGRGSRSPSPRGGRRGRLREGDKIEARYRGRSKYYKGRIRRDRGDGTFDVDCTRTQCPCLQSRRAPPAESENGRFTQMTTGNRRRGSSRSTFGRAVEAAAAATCPCPSSGVASAWKRDIAGGPSTTAAASRASEAIPCMTSAMTTARRSRASPRTLSAASRAARRG